LTTVFAGRSALSVLFALTACALSLPIASVAAPVTDGDGDGLSDRFERLRSYTDPQNRDSDADGLSDGDELRIVGSDPLEADSDSDGTGDGLEWLLGGDPTEPGGPWFGPPGPPPESPDTTPPATALGGGPQGVVSSDSATFGLASSEPASSFECRLDQEAWTQCASPKSLSGLAEGTHRFEARATDPAGNVDRSPASRQWTVSKPPPAPAPPPPAPVPPPAPAPPPPPTAGNCDVTAGSGGELRSAVAGNPGKTVCVLGNVGRVDLSALSPSSTVTVRPHPNGGRLGDVNATAGSDRITIDGLRFTSFATSGTPGNFATSLTLRNCVAGGEPGSRVDVFALVDIRQNVDGITIDGCDFGYTTSVGASGDTGFGIRAVNGSAGPIRNLEVTNTKLHHLACDGLQLAGVERLRLDRNEIAYIASDGTDLHADSLQILSLDGDPGQNRITNSYIHHTGFLAPGQLPPGGAAGQWLWHNYSDTGALVENNLIVDNRNYSPYWYGATSNVALRNNTIVRNGLAFGSNSPDMQWEGSGGVNRVAERNIIGAMGGGQGVTLSGNVFIDQSARGPSDIQHAVSFDADGNPTNLPASHTGAGYRKPAGVGW
jgi:hypothetical protein